MDGNSDEVVKWKAVAAAFHGGALDHCETFTSTEDAVRYLHSYQGHLRDEAATATVSRKHHDFYYHPDNLPGPVGLSVFFSHGVAYPCSLCKHASVTLNAGRFKYKCKAPVNVLNPLVHASPPERSSSDDLNLRRLEHLAVMHTPYFVMLFLELVKQKHYSFHTGHDAKCSIASYVFERLKEGEVGAFSREHDSFKFLKLWWRFQDRQSTRDLKLSMPSYFELHTDELIWNTRSDGFGKRKPEPLYTFLARNCLCHELCLSGRKVPAYPDGVSLSPTLRTLARGEVSTYCLSVLVPRVHLEDILHSLASVCVARQTGERGLVGQVGCRSPPLLPLTPKLDCLVLEDVAHDRAVMMHTITTLDSRWQPLSSWMTNMHGKRLQEPLVSTRNNVFLRVLGSLRDMCLQDKRPSRHLYSVGKTPQESRLAKAFFVHSETGDVLSLLPYVSLPRIHRSSNFDADEEKFRSACAQLALYILWSHIESEQVMLNKMKVTMDLWETHAACPAAMAERDNWSEIAYAFCKTGLVNGKLWYKLDPEEVGSRVTRKVDDVPHTWLGENSRTIEALKDRLLTLGFHEPLNVTVIELLREEEAHAIRESRSSFVTRTPEICRGLLAALTLPADNRTPFSSSFSCSYSSSSSSPCGALFHNMSAHRNVTESGKNRKKRSNNIVPDVARKVFQSHIPTDYATAVTATPSTSASGSVDTRDPARAHKFATDLNLTTHTVVFEDPETQTEKEMWTAPMSTTPNDVAVFFNDCTSQVSDWGFSNNTNTFHTRAPREEDDSGMADSVPRLLFGCFQQHYKVNPEVLIGMIQGNLTPDDQVSQDHMDTSFPQPDNGYQRSGDLDEATPVNQRPEMESNEDPGILAENKHWKTAGFKPASLETFGYITYKKMVYITCDRIALAKVREVKMQTLPTDDRPLSDPQQGLAEPPAHGGWTRPTDSSLVLTVNRRDPQNAKLNWEIGVESGLQSHASELFHPGNLNPKRIPCTTLSCKREMQIYKTVNLSRPPEKGFRHVELIVSEFPTLTRSAVPKTQLVISSKQTFYLGAVMTIENVKGLLLHKIFGNNIQVLQDILALHTSLQVHPFVPRTFALHLMKTPFLHKSVVGIFVGEAAGEWNLGCARGMDVMTETAKFTLAYHVLQCLLRVQILCLKVLGFTLKCIQPARIWRWRAGFRADFISCLADTVYMRHSADPVWGGAAGLATIQVTMQQLGLFQCLPDQVQDFMSSSATLFQTNVRRRDSVLERPHARTHVSLDHGDAGDLYTVYNMCAFTEQPISEQSGLDVILGTGCYEDISLQTMGLVVEPYGPFYIQIHHQHFKWNKAIIVEPVLDSPPHMAEVLRVLSSKERGELLKASNVSIRNREQASDSESAAIADARVSPRDLSGHVNTQHSVYFEY
ncbi:hypothetical protein D9C73_000053 [Collichthys lucidus]|uniref:Uncharacterized protein n=1 Tax=Collichthys lucidus TaxID=240159 RepID=A0A4U5TWH3_COLLU|nr:hypothetical protein D9C73_000053 [Collichthys lucidus]